MTYIAQKIRAIMSLINQEEDLDSPRLQYRIGLLRSIIYVNLATTIPLFLYLIFGPVPHRMTGIVIIVPIMIFNAWALQKVRKDHIKNVGFLVIGINWLTIAITTYNFGGLYSSIMLAMVILLLAATLLLPGIKARLFFYVITILHFFFLLFIELSGNLPYIPVRDLPLRILILIMTVTSVFLIVSYHLYTLRQSEQRLLQLQVKSERFRVQRELTQDLAHDLRTPLATLQTTAYLIRQRFERKMPVEEQVYKLESQVKRLNSLIDNLFEMTLLDLADKKKTLATIDLGKLLEACIHNARPHAQTREISISYHQDSSIETSYTIGDKQQLMRVFDNLIENAIHYGRDNGSIEICLTFNKPDYSIRIKDDGIGIAPEHQEQIFERFFRVDSARTTRDKQGTGIGLNAVQRIVQFHGGHIDLLSQPGKGSTFAITLPSLDHIKVIASFDETMEQETAIAQDLK